MTTSSWRVTVIGVEVPHDLGDDLQEFLEDRVPDAIVEVRRTITSAPRPGEARKVCE
jgi:hypothetical protein